MSNSRFPKLRTYRPPHFQQGQVKPQIFPGLSGSSARLLSREVASSMRGRAMEAIVSPFSFREVLRHAGRAPKPTDRLTKAERSQLDKDLLDYLAQGGFPEAQGFDTRNRFELLRTYVDVVLLRDVVEHNNLSQPQVLHWMVRQLLGNAAGSFSINKFHADLKSRGVAVGKDTLQLPCASGGCFSVEQP